MSLIRPQPLIDAVQTSPGRHAPPTTTTATVPGPHVASGRTSSPRSPAPPGRPENTDPACFPSSCATNSTKQRMRPSAAKKPHHFTSGRQRAPLLQLCIHQAAGRPGGFPQRSARLFPPSSTPPTPQAPGSPAPWLRPRRILFGLSLLSLFVFESLLTVM